MIDVLKDNICESCGKRCKYTSANAIHGFYCEDCLRIARKEEANSLASIRVARYEDKMRKRINNA